MATVVFTQNLRRHVDIEQCHALCADLFVCMKSIKIALVSLGVMISWPVFGEEKKDWHFLENDHLKIGLLKSHGGAIGWISKGKGGKNLINHYDHGRLIQQSYYGDADGSKWGNKEWRFNPVQGGSYKGKPSIVEEFRTQGELVYVKTVPRHWATGELLSQCTMEQWVELQGQVLKIRYRFTLSDNKKHKARHQEIPAVFVSPDLKNLVAYTGNNPWTNAPVSSRVPGWPNEILKLSENWAAYLSDEGEGIGIYVPIAKEATSYRYLGGSGSDCSYVAPISTFALTLENTFNYEAYFTLGKVKKIRKHFGKIREKETPPKILEAVENP